MSYSVIHPAVSVIIPVYNAEKHLAQCLDCVVDQTLRDIEIICVDDGSADCSLSILKEFGEKDSRIRIDEQSNKGAGAARNAGLDIARGKYLSFLDADDLFEPRMLECAMGEAERYSAEVVVFDADIFDSVGGGQMQSGWVVNKSVIPNGDVFCAKDVLSHIFTAFFMVAWNRLYSSEYIKKHALRFQEIEKHNDSYFSAMSLLHAERIRYLDSILAHYRKGTPYQISSGALGQRDYFPALDAMLAILDEISAMDGYGAMLDSFIDYSSTLLLLPFKNIGRDDYFRVFSLLKEKWLSRFSAKDFCEGRFRYYDEYRQMKSLLDNDAIGHLFTLLKIGNDTIGKLGFGKRWYFDDSRVRNGSDVVLYGASEIGFDYYRQFISGKQFNLVAWLDRNYSRLQKQGFPVEEPEAILKLEFDWVIVAVRHKAAAGQIMQALRSYGVPDSKIIWPI